MKYADVAINNKSDHTDNLYTYLVSDLCIKVGSKVYVPFGRGKTLKEAYVVGIKDELPKELLKKTKTLKRIEKVDHKVELAEEAIKTALWMRRKYVARYIDCILPFVPPATKFDIKEDDLIDEKIKEDLKKRFETTRIWSKGHDIFLLKAGRRRRLESYIEACKKTLAAGKEFVAILPEKSMIEDFAGSFRNIFGKDAVTVFDAGISAKKKYIIWQSVKHGRVPIVVGTRACLFLPFNNLGMIVLDREEDASHQSAMTPRYNSNQIAAKRCFNHNCPLILGSSIPSISTYYKAKTGVIKLIEKDEEINRDIFIENMNTELKEGNLWSISRKAVELMDETFAEGGKSLLLLNKKGYSNIEQNDRDYIPVANRGIEKIIEEISSIFSDMNKGYVPKPAILHGDINKKEAQQIIDAFNKGKTDILVATSMAVNQLKENSVDNIVLIDFDQEVESNVFGSIERGYYILNMCKNLCSEAGKIIIQTRREDNLKVDELINMTYEELYSKVISLRRMSKYPPFGAIIKIKIGRTDDMKTSETILKRIFDNVIRDLNLSIGKNKIIYRGQVTKGYEIIIKCDYRERQQILDKLLIIKEKTIEREKNNRFIFITDVNSYGR